MSKGLNKASTYMIRIDGDYFAPYARSSSQQKADLASNYIYEMGFPFRHLSFYENILSGVKDSGWSFPAQYAKEYEQLYSVATATKPDPDSFVGHFKVPTPYALHFEKLVSNCHGKFSSRITEDGQYSILDECNNTVMSLSADDDGYVTDIYSPLTRQQLSDVLLWFPRMQQDELQMLLGLPEPYEGTHEQYVGDRIDLELSWDQSFYRNFNKFNGRECYQSEPGAGRSYFSNTIREAVLTQYTSNYYFIGYPGYSVVEGDTELYTHGIKTCLGISIYDQRKKRTLLAHLFPGRDRSHYCYYNGATAHKLSNVDGRHIECSAEDPDRRDIFCVHESFPMEWYMGIFQREYFSDSDPEDIEVTVYTTKISDPWKTTAAIESAKRYFQGAEIDHIAIADWISINIAFDGASGYALIDDDVRPRHYD